jgi:hypothetical protein
MTEQRMAKAMEGLSGYKLRLIAQNTNNETARAAAIDEINRRNKTC